MDEPIPDGILDLSYAPHVGQCEESECRNRWEMTFRILANALEHGDAEVRDTHSDALVARVDKCPFQVSDEGGADTGHVYMLPDGRELFRQIEWVTDWAKP